MKRKIADANANGQNKKRMLSDEEAQGQFRSGLFKNSTLESLTTEYSKSQPFKHGVIRDLLIPSLLRSVRDEIKSNISFTPKETDIYKIHQSGDLANLDGLEDESLKLLPSLVMLRDALYSAPFREYLSHITGSGSLSGSKTDMAVNVYIPTCHLLCHDDVIGSRRVSYILYLTDPDVPWKPEWGGALRLYPTESMEDGSEIKLPNSDWSYSIPPAFNQLSFFAVQPGESFHDVEEVYRRKGDEAGEDVDKGRIRMAISGWYHFPQPGEDGYQENAEERQAEKSSLAQLQGNATQYDLPQPHWISHDNSIPPKGTEDEDHAQLTEDDLNLLIRFMNPRYLTPETVEQLAEAFSQDCSFRLAMFFSDKFSGLLRTQIESLEADPESTKGWTTARPPHKHRFQFLPSRMYRTSLETVEASSPLHQIVDELLPSLAFRKWLSLATDLTLDDCDILVRRFRKGLDYTLATAYEQRDPQLEVCFGITPTVGWGVDDESLGAGPAVEGEGNSAKNRTAVDGSDDDADNVGGYEVYMAGDEADDDAKSEADEAPASTHTGAGQRGNSSKKRMTSAAADPAVYSTAGEDGDDGILLSMPPSWNSLSVVLRDRGTLRFVKYVSQSAPGDRWDVFGIWKAEDEDGDDDDDEGASSEQSGENSDDDVEMGK